jgi:lactate permease
VYLALSLVLIFVFWPGTVRQTLQGIAWIPHFSTVTTNSGFITPASNGQAIRPLSHPGFWVLLTAGITLFIYSRQKLIPKRGWRTALQVTWKSAAPASIAIISTVALSSIMEHTGMTQSLAKELSLSFNKLFPMVSPWVGILGAFATGSNTNSNILFGAMQEDIAILLKFAPAWLIAAQTAGGSLGSMLSPTKVILGCSTVGLQGQEGSVLKLTLPIGLAIGLLLGGVVLLAGA